jgi:hypothetical protein
VFYLLDIPLEPLQDFHYDDSSEGEWFDFLDHAPQFAAPGAGRSAEKIDPDGSVDEDQ